MEIYKFNKSFLERLVEYQQILSMHKTKEAVSVSQIKSLWSCYLELSVESCAWHALWKIPRLLCKNYGIPSLTTVLVEVESINFPELSAVVKVECSQTDIVVRMMASSKYEIPLIELYPTIEQKSTAPDVNGIAVCIDQLRFFYDCIWWPWDIALMDNIDWVDHHLKSRMWMLFCMNRKVVSKQTSDIIGTLLQEANELEIVIKRKSAIVSAEEAERSEKKLMLNRYNHRFKQIRTHLEILENLSWETMSVKHNDLSLNITKKKSENINNKKMYCFVSEHSKTIKELQKVFHRIQILLPEDALVQIHENVQGALCKSNECDTILLPTGMHVIHEPCKLTNDITIKAIFNLNPDDSFCTHTFLNASDFPVTSAILELVGIKFHFENIFIFVGDSQAGIVAKRGSINIVNCFIRSVRPDPTGAFGIIVLPGAKVTIKNTIFYGLDIAVIVHPHGEVIMEECKTEECYDAIHITDDALLTLHKCQFFNLSNFAIRIDTTKYSRSLEAEYGNEILLRDVFQVSTSECEFFNIKIATVALQPRGIASVFNANTKNSGE